GLVDGNGGAGLYNYKGVLTIRNSSITQNTVYYAGGAGVSNFHGQVVIEDSVFADNQVGSSGYGGALLFDNANDDFEHQIVRTIFENNTSDGGGGAIFSEYAKLLIEDSEIGGNMASGDGGAILTRGLNLTTILGTTIRDNMAVYG